MCGKSLVRERKAELGFEMSAYTLKMVAVGAMVIQHFSIVFMQGKTGSYLLLVSLGKIAVPIMCFFIAEGFQCSSNRKRYLGRLLLFAALSHIPHALAFGFPIEKFWKYTSVMWSLSLGLVALIIWEKKKWNIWLRTVGVLICCVLSYPGNWNCVAIIWILGFGVYRDRPKMKWSIYFLGVLVNIVEYFVIQNDSFLLSNLTLVIPLFLLQRYNGQLGNIKRMPKRFFYWFYPVHLLVIYGLKVIGV